MPSPQEKDFDLISELGYLAIGSRMKRLADNIISDVTQIYDSLDIPFKAKFFATFRLLMMESPLSVIEIAKKLRITHPAVNQTVVEMIESDIISEVFDPRDKRKRLFIISKSGEKIIPKLKLVWQNYTDCVKEFMNEFDFDIIECIGKMEKSLERESFFERFKKKNETN